MKIKILGPGCMNCEKLYQTTYEAVAELKLDADIEKVSDLREIQKYIMMTPGLVVDEKVIHQGKPLPDKEKVKKLLQTK
ncbi:MAG: thioredoxin family protein [Proteobacteria bacterium]|nr:thioredoxin family protein [Pseudomonadota bacterium]